MSLQGHKKSALSFEIKMVLIYGLHETAHILSVHMISKDDGLVNPLLHIL